MGMQIRARLGIEAQWITAKGHPRLKPEQTHAWLEVGGLIVDITHDQFESTGLSGWVFEESRGWHAEFKTRESSSVSASASMLAVAGYGAMSAELDMVPEFAS